MVSCEPRDKETDREREKPEKNEENGEFSLWRKFTWLAEREKKEKRVIAIEKRRQRMEDLSSMKQAPRKIASVTQMESHRGPEVTR